MRRTVMISLMLVLVVALIATPIMAKGGKTCIRIQDGILEYSAGHYLEGEPLTIGYDIFGYNYQAHLFNGFYPDAYNGGEGNPPYSGDDETYLQMKWNDAWLSNRDCDSDGALDRHLGFDSYIGSGAWLTNHQRGEDEYGKWTYFVKIVAVPEDAYEIDGIWYADGTEIGPDIWGQFAIILQVYNDKGTGDHGVYYKSPASPGFGFYKP